MFEPIFLQHCRDNSIMPICRPKKIAGKANASEGESNPTKMLCTNWIIIPKNFNINTTLSSIKVNIHTHTHTITLILSWDMRSIFYLWLGNHIFNYNIIYYLFQVSSTNTWTLSGKLYNLYPMQICVLGHRSIHSFWANTTTTHLLDVYNKILISYDLIPNFPLPKYKCSCEAEYVAFGKIGQFPVIFFTDIPHFYDSYIVKQCAMSVGMVHFLGVIKLMITITGAAINQSLIPGDVVLIKDHINIMGTTGRNLLRGKYEEKFGPRFPETIKPYNAQ